MIPKQTHSSPAITELLLSFLKWSDPKPSLAILLQIFLYREEYFQVQIHLCVGQTESERVLLWENDHGCAVAIFFEGCILNNNFFIPAPQFTSQLIL